MNHRVQRSDDVSRAEDAPDSQARSTTEPSWFLDPANDGLRNELTERYRQSRNLPAPSERTFPQSARMDRQRQTWVESHSRPPADFLSDRGREDPRQSIKQQRRPADTSGLAGTFAIAAFAAALCGGAAGVINANIEPIRKAVMAFGGETRDVAKDNALRPVAPPASTQTVISKKPVATATLEVNDVAGETNSLIPLAVHAEPALEGQDLLLRISGLPDHAYLTSGQKIDQVWTLAMKDLENLKLVMPDTSNGHIDVAVAAFERKTGELAAPVKSMTIALSDAVVQPASAPPPSAIQPTALQPPAEGQLAAIPPPTSMGIGSNTPRDAAVAKAVQADGLLAKGDIAGARKLYAEAWSLGSAEGAYGLGRSYDPVALAILKLAKTNADSNSAIQWYEKAAAAGYSAAISAIVRLRLKPS